MILTYNLKHGRDFSAELEKARLVARFAVANRDKLSSKHVSDIGLKSEISNQILRKYGNNRKCEVISSVLLTIPGQNIKRGEGTLRVPCLKLELDASHLPVFEKVNQIEVGPVYAHVSVTVSVPPPIQPEGWIGVDLNTTGHSCVVADPATGKVLKLGKSENHVRTSYRRLRRRIQMSRQYRRMKRLKRRERNKIRDLNHKISRKIVETAAAAGRGIAFEDLTGIRENRNKKTSKSFKAPLNNWSFFDLRSKTEYKARLRGIPVVLVPAANTSKACSRCGRVGDRDGKTFKCPHCGYADHADVNAAFNIGKVASTQKGMCGTGALMPRLGNPQAASAA